MDSSAQLKQGHLLNETLDMGELSGKASFHSVGYREIVKTYSCFKVCLGNIKLFIIYCLSV